MENSQQNNLDENPYFKPLPASASYSTAWTNDEYKEVKALLPLNTGIFTNDKIFPIAMTEGLIVEIIFEDVRKVFRTLEQTNKNRYLNANPVFMSTNGSNLAPDYPVAVNASKFQEFFVRRDNCQGWSGDIKSFPFCVGEEVRFMNASTGVDIPSVADGTTDPKIERIEYISGTTNAIKVRLNGSYRPSVTMDAASMLYSRAVIDAATYNPSYTITNAEFILQQVEMPAGYTSKLSQMMKAGGAMNYDFISATNYKVSQLKSERVANIRLPLSQSRAKAVLCIPTDASASATQALLSAESTYITHYSLGATALSNAQNKVRSQRTGITGCADEITAYQLFYEGKLNPNRKVFCNKIASKNSIDQQPLIELEKALVMGGIKPFSLNKFRENFCIGRALSLQNGVYDTRGTDFALQVEYQEVNAPTVDKLWNCFCIHLRRIAISGSAIALQV